MLHHIGDALNRLMWLWWAGEWFGPRGTCVLCGVKDRVETHERMCFDCYLNKFTK